MSVSDPLIKDIKAYTHKLLEKINEYGRVTDSFQYLTKFCQKLETIFYTGLYRYPFSKCSDPYTWMTDLSLYNSELINFAYRSSVDDIKESKIPQTNAGKFKLLVRYCLAKKCLHVPVEFLVRYNKRNFYYRENSVLGDEILSQIFISVLLQCSKIDFQLDLSNVYFLDTTWLMPEILKVELVPCYSLGLGVSFSDDRAIIVDINSNGVVAENGNISVGDVLENINGVRITSSSKGKLNTIIRNNKGKPTNLVVIKGIRNDTKEAYAPLRKYLLDVHLDVLELQKRASSKDCCKETINCPKIRSKNGYKCSYIGSVDVGTEGDVKHVKKGIEAILKNKLHAGEYPSTKHNKSVVIELGEIGLKVVDTETCEELLNHSYMRISACGSNPYMPNYFAFITGDDDCNIASKFTCYVFHTKNCQEIFTLLSSIGQGFKRTHFAV